MDCRKLVLKPVHHDGEYPCLMVRKALCSSISESSTAPELRYCGTNLCSLKGLLLLLFPQILLQMKRTSICNAVEAILFCKDTVKRIDIL